MNLTQPQKNVLLYIDSYVEFHGFPPSRKEICDNFGWRSINSSRQHINSLCNLGALDIDHRKYRAMHITKAGKLALKKLKR